MRQHVYITESGQWYIAANLDDARLKARGELVRYDRTVYMNDATPEKREYSARGGHERQRRRRRESGRLESGWVGGGQ